MSNCAFGIKYLQIKPHEEGVFYMSHINKWVVRIKNKEKGSIAIRTIKAFKNKKSADKLFEKLISN